MPRGKGRSPSGDKLEADGPAALATLCDSTVGEALRTLTTAFAAGGADTPALDARRLVTGILGIDDVVVFRQPERVLTGEEGGRLAGAARRRLAHEPVSRILGYRHFHGLKLSIDPSTLDPRPDTETLVDGVLGLVADGQIGNTSALRILDIGTGSGAILLALLKALEHATGVGVDLSEDAVGVARCNAADHALSGRADFHWSHWADAVEGAFDIVVSNPPYIVSGEIESLEPDVRLYDPRGALDGGSDGLDAYRVLIPSLQRVLKPGGWVALEVGAGQAPAVGALLLAAERAHAGAAEGFRDVTTWSDMAGVARCVAAKARSA